MKIILLGGLRNGVIIQARESTGVGTILPVTRERTLVVLGPGNILGKTVKITEGPYHAPYSKRICAQYSGRVLETQGQVEWFKCEVVDKEETESDNLINLFKDLSYL